MEITELSSKPAPAKYADAAALLSSIALFSDLDPEEVRELASATHRRAMRRGALIVEQDSLGETAFILLSGEVDIVSESSDGRELLLARILPGEIFGEMSLLDSEPRSASALARQDSDVFVISRSELLAQLERHPRIMLRLLQSLSRRLRRADERLNGFAFHDVA
ncbi:MAG: Crp/Fnr family transcriptional regulator, partial [Dehalococcoidia bacterium]